MREPERPSADFFNSGGHVAPQTGKKALSFALACDPDRCRHRQKTRIFVYFSGFLPKNEQISRQLDCFASAWSWRRIRKAGKDGLSTILENPVRPF
jgi:hypothetical protein